MVPIFKPEGERIAGGHTQFAKLSIIFVNWNSCDFLRECIYSIHKYTHEIGMELIVVDNASRLQDVDKIKEQFPHIILIKSQENLGFARANNLGVIHSTGAYLLFLNPDTQLVGPAINIMLEHLKSLPIAGCVGAKLLNTDLSVQTSCIQKYPTILNQVTDIEYIRLRWPHCRLWGIDVLFSANPKTTTVEAISGACLMIKREVFERVGMFSEEYFMYTEDVDLCYKVERAGFRNYYVGEAMIIHHGGKSSGQRETSEWATMMKLKSRLHFCFKTRGSLYGWMFRVAIGLIAALRLLIIVVVFPFVCRKNLRRAFVKWRTTLKWAAGFA